ncbi:YHS domain-containing (seleno)protein [Cypionkella psychrotolerans]|uniref:YHS domain-containing (seleno)protein n=1 Tax=Cypionkella psychrotolerans TaxID=1678131 RepID=UPI000B2AFCBE|nr:YHS domain-containing (seleno)protein [Cypionkella psychrotolerans]
MFKAVQVNSKHMTRVLAFTAMTGMALVAGVVPVLADGTFNTGYFEGIAIKGYDTVAYFTENRAVKGSEEYSYEWLGTPWYFVSAKHRDLFQSNPVKYAPQYGGYCAGEVVGGSVTVDIDPEAFKIIDGKLYLIYDKTDADDFEAHASDYIPKADANWPEVKAELEQDLFN